MDPLVYIVGAVLVVLVLVSITFLRQKSPEDGRQQRGPEVGEGPRQRGDMPPGAAARRRGARQRMAAAQRRQDDSEEEGDNIYDDIEMPEGKIGAKKMAKIQAKAEKRAQREAEVEEREERKTREARMAEQRKKEELRKEQEEKALEAEEQRLREEKEAREHEEYLKLKEAFTVDEEGTHEAELNQDTESLLQEFINYIKDMKVVMLEDLASHFKIKTQDAIDRVQTLLEEDRLSGVMDDRGKFIYITRQEYEAVAKFIKQRGRVSISELAESSNQLVNMNPDNKETLQRLVAGETAA